MRLIIDAHLDLSWNALSYDRDQTRTVADIRKSEAGMTGKGRGKNTVSLPEMRRGKVGLCLATLLARAVPDKPWYGPAAHASLGTRGPKPEGRMRTDLDFCNQQAAWGMARGQLAYYEILEAQGELKMIRTRADLDAMAAQWQAPGTESSNLPIGYILSMEGADPIVTVDHAQHWWDLGLRTVCLAHYGPSAYAMGTGGDGDLSPAGRELCKRFDEMGMILDLVHTADRAIDQALEHYSRPVFVSHGNARALVPGDRQMSDQHIKAIAARGGVLGAVLDAWMLSKNYKPGAPVDATLAQHVADHIDYICQLTGSHTHTAIGSDLDGGFGTEQSPSDLDTIADLQKLDGILAGRGYSSEAIDAIFHGNWLRFFRESLPAD